MHRSRKSSSTPERLQRRNEELARDVDRLRDHRNCYADRLRQDESHGARDALYTRCDGHSLLMERAISQLRLALLVAHPDKNKSKTADEVATAVTAALNDVLADYNGGIALLEAHVKEIRSRTRGPCAVPNSRFSREPRTSWDELRDVLAMPRASRKRSHE